MCVKFRVLLLDTRQACSSAENLHIRPTYAQRAKKANKAKKCMEIRLMVNTEGPMAS